MIKDSSILNKFGFGLSIAAAMIISTFVVAKTYVHIKESQNVITVKGYAEKKITSESAVWNGSIEATNADWTTAVREVNTLQQKVSGFLAQEGYTPQQISFGQAYTSTQYQRDEEGMSTNVIDYYTISQSITVSGTDVKKIGGLPDKINALALEGHRVSSSGVSFYYPSDKLEELKLSLLGESSKNARERAEQFAVNSGTTVGRLLNARQGVFQVTAPNSSDMSDYGSYDTSSIDKIVKIVVTMTYGIDR